MNLWFLATWVFPIMIAIKIIEHGHFPMPFLACLFCTALGFVIGILTSLKRQ